MSMQIEITIPKTDINLSGTDEKENIPVNASLKSFLYPQRLEVPSLRSATS